MRIAIPLVGGKLSAHFGHCEQFAVIDADTEARTITASELDTPPPHEPGVLPQWLAGKGVNVIISGGMGVRAQQLFAGQGIDVVVGAPTEEPRSIAEHYLAGTLRTGGNVCDH